MSAETENAKLKDELGKNIQRLAEARDGNFISTGLFDYSVTVAKIVHFVSMARNYACEGKEEHFKDCFYRSNNLLGRLGLRFLTTSKTDLALYGYAQHLYSAGGVETWREFFIWRQR